MNLNPAPSRPFLAACLAIGFGRLLFALRNPPADWDSIHYHLPMVAHWIVTGTTGAPLRDPPPFGAYFPGASELLQAFAALILRRETLMTWPTVAALPLIALGVRRLALRAGAAAAAAEVCALALVASECVMRLTLGTRIDVPLALWAALTALFLLEALRARAAGLMALALLAAGLFVGSKTNAPFLLALLGLALSAGRVDTLRALAVRQRAGLALGLFVGGYWYARNFWITGNPLFPAPISLGPLRLAGIENGIDLLRTTQVAQWLEGYSGHLTWGRLLANFGFAVPFLAIAGGLAVFRLLRQGSSAGAIGDPREGARLSAFALSGFALFLVSPFSGACAQAGPGTPPLLNLDNLRLLLPALIAAVPAGAALFPRSATGRALIGLTVALMLLTLRPFLGHLVPGLVAAMVAVLAPSPARRLVARHAFAALLVVAAGVGVTAAAVDPVRERISDQIWDGYLQNEDNLTAAEVRRVREASAGAPFAVTGMNAWAAYYGRDFSGRPHYMPLDRPWQESSFAWSFRPDPRRDADRGRWLRNLEAAGVACVVVRVDPEAIARTPEWSWCLTDRRNFEPITGGRNDRAWRIRR